MTTTGGNWKEMFRAACDGDLELVRFHIENGVDVDYAHPEFQSTALVACILAGQQEVAGYLLDRGADPTLESHFEGMTPVQAAREAGLTKLAERLRAMGSSSPQTR